MKFESFHALTSLCFHCTVGFSQTNGSRTWKTPWSMFQDFGLQLSNGLIMLKRQIFTFWLSSSLQYSFGTNCFATFCYTWIGFDFLLQLLKLFCENLDPIQLPPTLLSALSTLFSISDYLLKIRFCQPIPPIWWSHWHNPCIK